MARLQKQSSFRYLINGLILALPIYFIYKALNPEFPAMLPEIKAGEFSLTAMPYDENMPYQHDGLFVKDFLVMFQQGSVDDVRMAFLNIGESPLPFEEAQSYELGVLHGTKHGQHVHGLSSEVIKPGDKVWITLQTWDGKLHQGAWQVPSYLLSDV